MRDPIVERVRELLHLRSQTGIEIYGTTLGRTDLSRLEWLKHARNEALDLSLYLERLIFEEETKDGYEEV